MDGGSHIKSCLFCLTEEEEEELSPLSPPPTLSITEEILEFINQSRAREGLAAIHTDTAVHCLLKGSKVKGHSIRPSSLMLIFALLSGGG